MSDEELARITVGWISTLSPQAQHDFGERAAIREHDGGYRRPEAEIMAFMDTQGVAGVVEMVSGLLPLS